MLESVWTNAPEVSSTHRFSFETALIELVSNVFRHGDAGSGVSCVVCVEISPRQLDATLRDDGIPVPVGLVPTELTPVDQRAPMPDALSESARGFPLIRALVDVLGYSRDGNYNTWHIVRRMDS